MPAKSSLYDRDFYAWSIEQAALLRQGRVAEADLENIAEEIESMGKAEKREFVGCLTVLILHLLKWRYQPSGRGNSWKPSIADARDEIAETLMRQRLETLARRYMRDLRRTAFVDVRV